VVLITIALALILNAEPADGGGEAASIASSSKLSTALKVTQVDGSGGTMHFAQKTVISCVRCGRPLQLKTETGPLIDHVVELGDKRFLLLGWSSGGGGQQSVHALLVHVASGGPELIDELEWSTARADRGVLVMATPEGWRIGLPQPRLQSAQLSVSSGKPRSSAELGKGGFFVPVSPELKAFSYSPPFGERLPLRGNVGWVTLSEAGFTAPEGPR
jgi:hypothetical protein